MRPGLEMLVLDASATRAARFWPNRDFPGPTDRSQDGVRPAQRRELTAAVERCHHRDDGLKRRAASDPMCGR